MGAIYMKSWKQCAIPVITTMALWQLMHLGTWWFCSNSCTQVHKLPQSHCGNNREGTLFSWLHIYIYIYNIYIFTNLPVNAIIRLPHPRSGDSQGQETFLTPSADKQTRNYDTECSNHHPSLSTIRPKGLSRSKMK